MRSTILQGLQYFELFNIHDIVLSRPSGTLLWQGTEIVDRSGVLGRSSTTTSKKQQAYQFSFTFTNCPLVWKFIYGPPKINHGCALVQLLTLTLIISHSGAGGGHRLVAGMPARRATWWQSRMGLPGTVRRVQIGARQWWSLAGAITTAYICALPKLRGEIVNTLCCFTPRHPHLSGVRQGLWNSTFGCCTSALSATSISAFVQVVGPDPGFKHLAGPVSPS